MPTPSGISLWPSGLVPTTMPSGGTFICPAPGRPRCPNEAAQTAQGWSIARSVSMNSGPEHGARACLHVHGQSCDGSEARMSFGSQVRKKACSHFGREAINPVTCFYSRQVFPNSTNINIHRKGSRHCPGRLEGDSGPVWESVECLYPTGQGLLCDQSPGWGIVPCSGKRSPSL